MALFKRINPEIKTNNDTGFGINAGNQGGRFINKDGSFNVRKRGMPVWTRSSLYYNLLMMPAWKFLSAIAVFFIVMNLLFTSFYFLLGADQLTGYVTKEPWHNFKELFFFSTQTFTTVGYGRMNPVGDAANIVAAIEALMGFMTFAVITGLVYGRFSRPKSYLMFSKLAVVAPYQNSTGLMFRFATYKDKHLLTDVEVKVTLGLTLRDDGNEVFRFYNLALERSRVDSLPLSWTIVHPINEDSPLYNFAPDDFKNTDAEMYVLVKAFDDTFSNTVLQRTSYTAAEIKFNAKFTPMYHESEDGQTTIIDLDLLDAHKEL